MKHTRQDRAFYAVTNTLLFLALVLTGYPILLIISSSFSAPLAVASGRVWLYPVDFSLDGYRAVFANQAILTGYANTLFYATFGTLYNVAMTVLAAYPLARKDLVGRSVIMFLFTFTMIFNGGLIPMYLLIRSLGLINTRWVMIIPPAIGVWNVIITRTFFETNIPTELLEAARMDGLGDIRFLTVIVLPLSKAIVAVLVLFSAVSHWNAFFNAFLYLSDPKLYPLQVVLRDILVLNTLDVSMADPELLAQRQGLADLLKYSLIIVASLPVVVLYPFIQRYFVQGVMLGSMKG